MIKNAMDTMFVVAMMFVMLLVVACEPAKAPALPEDATQAPVEASEGFQGVQAPTGAPVDSQSPTGGPEVQMGTGGEVPQPQAPTDTQKQSYTMPPMIVN